MDCDNTWSVFQCDHLSAWDRLYLAIADLLVVLFIVILKRWAESNDSSWVQSSYFDFFPGERSLEVKRYESAAMANPLHRQQST